MDRDSVEVFLPDPDDCYERLRRARFGATVSCVYCGESEPVIKKETTGKSAQQYRCKECETYFNDLTQSFFEHRKFPRYVSEEHKRLVLAEGSIYVLPTFAEGLLRLSGVYCGGNDTRTNASCRRDDW